MPEIHGGAPADDGTIRFVMRCERSRRYEVIAAAVADPSSPMLARAIGDRRALLVTTPTVDRLYGAGLRHVLARWGVQAEVSVIPLGEARKSMITVLEICSRVRQAGLGRHDVLVAFGGGVCSDVVSLAASLVRRGLPYVCVPTTLVGMVDAAIGLKGGVNFRGAKNYLGCFLPPEVALVDLTWLRTLPRAELRCGVSEMVKMALVRDPGLFRLLEDNGRALLGSAFQSPPDIARDAVGRSIGLMLEELEPNGYEDRTLERLVDFGHTFSGAMEERSGFTLRHGHAVAVDMVLTGALGVELGLLAEPDWHRIVALYHRLHLPFLVPQCTPVVLAEAVRSTVAHRGGRLNLVIPTGIGDATFLRDAADLSPALLHRALRRLRIAASPAMGPAGPEMVDLTLVSPVGRPHR